MPLLITSWSSGLVAALAPSAQNSAIAPRNREKRPITRMQSPLRRGRAQNRDENPRTGRNPMVPQHEQKQPPARSAVYPRESHFGRLSSAADVSGGGLSF